MHCPKCGAEYREGYTKCSDCNVELVNRSLEYKKNQKKSKDIRSMLLPSAESVFISVKVILAETIFLFMLVLLTGVIFLSWSQSTIVSVWIFLIIIIVNSFVIPIFLSIHNLKINVVNRKNIFVVNFLLIGLTIVVLFIESYYAVCFVDKRILIGYDKRQEINGGMLYLGGFYISHIVNLVIGIINQIILIIKRRGDRYIVPQIKNKE